MKNWNFDVGNTDKEYTACQRILSGRIATADVVRVDFDKSSGKVAFAKQ